MYFACRRRWWWWGEKGGQLAGSHQVGNAHKGPIAEGALRSQDGESPCGPICNKAHIEHNLSAKLEIQTKILGLEDMDANNNCFGLLESVSPTLEPEPGAGRMQEELRKLLFGPTATD